MYLLQLLGMIPFGGRGGGEEMNLRSQGKRKGKKGQGRGGNVKRGDSKEEEVREVE